MSKRQREKLMNGMSSKQAKVRFLSIWGEKHAELDFVKLHGKLWPWLETWHRLRSRNETLEQILTSFASTIRTKNLEIHRLSGIIAAQRKELAKRYAELEALKSASLQGEP